MLIDRKFIYSLKSYFLLSILCWIVGQLFDDKGNLEEKDYYWWNLESWDQITVDSKVYSVHIGCEYTNLSVYFFMFRRFLISLCECESLWRSLWECNKWDERVRQRQRQKQKQHTETNMSTTQHNTAPHSTAQQNTTRRVKNTHNKHVAKVFFISFFFSWFETYQFCWALRSHIQWMVCELLFASLIVFGFSSNIVYLFRLRAFTYLAFAYKLSEQLQLSNQCQHFDWKLNISILFITP